MTQPFDLAAIVNQAAQESVDLSEASKGGEGASIAATGTCIATLVGYIEVGRKLKKGFKGAPDKKIRRAHFIFELAGGANKHTVTENGTKVAKRITVKTWLPEPGKKPSDKSGFFKLFNALNYDKNPDVKIPAQLLGKHVKVDVGHEKFTPQGGEEITFASIGSAQDGYRISPPTIDVIDPDSGMPTGEKRVIPAPEVVSQLRCFLWDYATKEMWDSLFIDGFYDEVKDEKTGKVTREAKSKNVIQEEIKQALDWEGSPMHNILSAGGELDVDELADTPAAAASDLADPLADLL